MKDKFIRTFYQAQALLKNNMPTILTTLGAVGVIGTAVATAKDTPKAMEKVKNAEKEKGDKLTIPETVIIVTPCYISAIAIGAASIGCIIGANITNQRKHASLMSAYTLLNNYHKAYRGKLIELHGEEADVEIRNALIREYCDFHPIDCDVPDGKVIFVDEISGNSVLRYEREVMDAEYHLNRNFVLRGYASLNEFYEFMGMPQTDYGEEIGWTVTDGFYWIDFQHRLVSKDENGTDIVAIDMVFSPDTGYLEEWE